MRKAQREISSHEFAEWMAYNELCPIGLERFDLLAGIIASAAVAPYTKKGKRPAKPSDFMPQFGAVESRRQSPQEIKRKFVGLTAMMNAPRSKK